MRNHSFRLCGSLAALIVASASFWATTANAAKPKPAPSAASSVSLSAPIAAPQASLSPLASALARLEKSEYERAELELRALTKGSTAPAAWLGLGRLFLTVGKHSEALSAAATASRSSGQIRFDALALQGEILAAQGKIPEAVALLEPLKSEQDARRAHLVLGQCLINQGKRVEARPVLMLLVDDYNQDRVKDTDSEGLALVGRAVHLLRKASEANNAYNEAERAGPHRVETLIWRAELFFEKYDPGHAEELLKEALKIAPENPDVRILLARVKLEQSFDFDAAEALSKKALSVNPKHTVAYFVKAGLALRDFDLKVADAAVDEGLKTNPLDLQLLSIRAAVRFLADDRAGFEAAKQKVFATNPEFTTFYQIVADFAEWEHRYDDIVAMMRQAVTVDPKDGKAWAVLGLNLIRAGDDASALDALRKAWTFDKFNVRAYNTLNLFERDIPKSYDSVDAGHFRYRYDKTERGVLERYAPLMLEEAYASMVSRYGFTPAGPIGIELYSSRENFSVRTSGLPNVGIQGVCFGKTLAALSPKAEPFNWGNVLWHELGHIFAIQMSKNHVPRWFTEGLSEYETFIRRPEWQREEDVALYVALRSGRIPAVGSFNRAFTHVDDVGDVTMAYYTASQIVTYIAETSGMPKIAEMLRLWGQGMRDGDVVQKALGFDMAELDRRFRTWLEPRLRRYRNQYVPDLRAPSLEDAQAAVKAKPTDARKQVELFLAAVEAGDKKLAESAVEKAKELAPNDPTVRFVTAQFFLKTKKAPEAARVLGQMIKDKQDGFSVRMAMADIAENDEDLASMRAHLEAARRFDPTQVEPLQALYDIAKKEKRTEDQISALRELAVLDQHERRVYGRLLTMLAEGGKWEDVRRVGERAVFVDVHSPVVHRVYGQGLANGGEHAKAIFEFESAVLCYDDETKKEAASTLVLIAKEHLAMKAPEKAKEAARKALELDPENEDAKKMAK